MTLGERVKAVRQNAGLSQPEFAQSVSASRDMIANIEADRITNLATKKPLLQLICEKYNCRREWLLNGTGEMLKQESQADEMCRLVKKLYSSKASSLKKDIITAVLQTPDKNFDVLEDMMQQILKGVATRMLKP
jgi:transcriptional regulator with XRE-family HTH domain